MKKLIIGICICVLLSIVTSLFKINISKEAISTIYTVSGIMFSIGMSLVVTSNTSGVKNKIVKDAIRDKLKDVRSKFLVCFVLISILYIIIISIDTNELIIFNSFSFNYYHLLSFILLYSIIYFIGNFISIEKLNHEIQDAVDTELENKN
jgi:hypothetical protein